MITLNDLYSQIPAMQAFSANLGMETPNEASLTRQAISSAQKASGGMSRIEKIDTAILLLVAGVVIYGAFIRKGRR